MIPWSHAGLLCPCNSPGKNTEVDCHALVQKIFPTQGSNPGLQHCGQILYYLSYQGSHGSSIFNILRKITVILSSESTNLYCQSYFQEIYLSAHPCQHLLFMVFWIIAILIGVRCWFWFPWWLVMLSTISYTCLCVCFFFWKSVWFWFPWWLVMLSILSCVCLCVCFFLGKIVYSGHLLIFFSFIFISWRLITLQYCSGFYHKLTWISHGVTCIPHPDPPPNLPLDPIPWLFPVHQARALVSCIQPGLVICFILDNIHVSMLFSRNIPPSHSPTEFKSLFCTSVSLFCFAYRVIVTIFLNSIYMH